MKKPKKRVYNEIARKRISEAQKRRWEAWRKAKKATCLLVTLAGLIIPAFAQLNVTANNVSAKGYVRVGTTLPAAYFRMINLATIPAAWTLDYTTPTTAIQSMLPGVTPNGNNGITVSGTVAANVLSAVTLGISGGTTFNGTVYGTSSATFQGALSVGGGATITGTLNAGSLNANNSTISGNESVSGSLTAGSVAVVGSLSAGSISANISTVSGSSTVTGAASFGSTVQIGNNTHQTTETDYYWTVSNACSTGTGQPVQCLFSTALPGAMPDASYQIFCQASPTTASVDAGCTIDEQSGLPTVGGSTIAVRVTQIMQNGTGGSSYNVHFHAHHS